MLSVNDMFLCEKGKRSKGQTRNNIRANDARRKIIFEGFFGQTRTPWVQNRQTK